MRERSSSRRRAWIAGVVLVLASAALFTGCSTVGYLAQSASGHIGLMRAARPVDALLDDPATPAPLRERLRLARRIRDYAVAELGLPDNASYRRYAALDRPAAVWNVVAAPELSLTLRTWCFPIVGCVGYRGYYRLDAADAAAEGLRAEGLESSVYPVPAYSTLGYLNWAGGDPLLSTFIDYNDAELARLVFHELSHQVAYASGDTVFNESFATTVERLGVARWLDTQAAPGVRESYERIESRRDGFLALAFRTRSTLEAIYASDRSDADKRRAKAAAMDAFRADYAATKAGPWAHYDGYDAWVARANNAQFGVLAAYTDEVPQFERLYEREGRDLRRFYAQVARLAALPRDERHRALQAP